MGIPKANAVLGTVLTFLATDSAVAEVVQDAVDDELVVTAERANTLEAERYEIVASYDAACLGNDLATAGKYAEALPHLDKAARKGFKYAQVRLGDILLYGRGGVQRNVMAGIGWIAVAAHTEKPTRPNGEIRAFYKRVRKEYRHRNPDVFDRAAEVAIERFYNSDMICDFTTVRGSARLREYRCVLDETVCYPGIEADGDVREGRIWLCPPTRHCN